MEGGGSIGNAGTTDARLRRPASNPSTSATLERAKIPLSAVMREETPLHQKRHRQSTPPSSSLQPDVGQTSSHSASRRSTADHDSTSLWQRCTQMSVFAFSNEQLETAFHHYMERHYDLGTIMLPAFILVAWVMFIFQYLSSTQQACALSPQAWAVAACQPLLAIALLLLQVAQPQWYITHQKAVRVGAHLFLLATFSHSREMLLWFRTSRAGQRDASPVALLQAFLTENMYFSTAWLGVISLCVGQVVDFLVVVLFLLIETRNNSRMCASTACGGGHFGATGHRLVEAACTPLRAWVGLPAPMRRPFDPSSCPASLMFWQVLGAWLACIVVLVNDVWQRRVFLRSGAARALVPQPQRGSAEAWPFSRYTGGALVLWTSMCLAMVPYLLQIGTSYCLALA